MGSEGKKKALVISVSEYSGDALLPLPFCKNDGEAMETTLEELGYDVVDKNNLIGNVSDTNIENAIKEFFGDSELQRTDTILFYYSGHGVRSPQSGEVYLASSKTDTDRPMFGGFALSRLTRMMNECKSDRIITILDSCYSGQLNLPLGKKGKSTVAGLAQTYVEKESASLKQGTGKTILCASQDFQESFPTEDKSYSLFTKLLIEGLNGADGRSCVNGVVTPDSLLDYISVEIDKIPDDEKNYQTPILKGEKTGKIILAEHLKFAEDIEEKFIELLQAEKVDEFNSLRKKNPMRDLILDDIELVRKNLEGINLQQVKLRNSKLNNSNLRNANLSNAILTGTKIWETNLTGANLSGADLSMANFTRSNLQDIDLRDAVLSNADLRGSDLRSANLVNADFTNADLTGVDFLNANVSGANFQSSKCMKAGFWGVNLSEVNLAGAKLLAAILIKANLTKAKLPFADLTGANLSEADLTGADLKYANLAATDLTKTNLTEADLTGVDLSLVDLTSAKTDGCIGLEQSKEDKLIELLQAEKVDEFNSWRKENPNVELILDDIDLTGKNLKGVNFKDVKLRDANLHEVNLETANLTKADLTKADLTKANLTKADLSYAYLFHANLSGSDLTKANLTNADLSYANISYTNLSGTNLSGANLAKANLSRLPF